MDYSFPKDFLWGAATASYQIEGASTEGGRGASIWDVFSDTPGKVFNGDNGDVACDHYHRYVEDVGLMADLGLQGYRFSIAWPRILPNGTGTVNEVGLDFYDKLVDELLKKNITPYITLYHWDLPQALQDKGGWADRATVDAYVNYAEIVARRLGDRINNWITHNEPWVVAFLGNELGIHAPGLKDLSTATQVAHHLLLSHGLAVRALRPCLKPEAQIGITLNLGHYMSATDSQADHDAARRYDGYNNRWFLDPLFKGAYPEDMWQVFEGHHPTIADDDLAVISTPIDFLGINYYTRGVQADDPNGGVLKARQEFPEADYTEMQWEIYPDGLYQLLTSVQNTYNPSAIYVTENGAAFADEISADGHVHDERRTAYLQGHFAAAHRAIQDGAKLQGYFVWSLMDNFEWSFGYSKRFGITFVDYTTQKRTLKDSALWYRQVIQANGF
jgi:beta-glucosidase